MKQWDIRKSVEVEKKEISTVLMMNRSLPRSSLFEHLQQLKEKRLLSSLKGQLAWNISYSPAVNLYPQRYYCCAN